MTPEKEKIRWQAMFTGFADTLADAASLATQIGEDLAAGRSTGSVYSPRDAYILLERDDVRVLVDELMVMLDRFVAISVSVKEEPPQFWKRVNMWVKTYILEYEITPKEPDLFKYAYGFGWAFADFVQCESNRPGRYLPTVRIARLLLLNTQLDRQTSFELHPFMISKLAKTMVDDKEAYNFGYFGLYAIFKNCSLFHEQLGQVAAVS